MLRAPNASGGDPAVVGAAIATATSTSGGAALLLSPFGLAVSFMLAGVQRFEQPVTEALRGLVLGWYRDAAALASTRWLPARSAQRPGAGSDAPSPKCDSASGKGLEAALLRCTRNTGHCHAGLLQPMVRVPGMMHWSLMRIECCYQCRRLPTPRTCCRWAWRWRSWRRAPSRALPLGTAMMAAWTLSWHRLLPRQ